MLHDFISSIAVLRGRSGHREWYQSIPHDKSFRMVPHKVMYSTMTGSLLEVCREPVGVTMAQSAPYPCIIVGLKSYSDYIYSVRTQRDQTSGMVPFDPS